MWTFSGRVVVVVVVKRGEPSFERQRSAAGLELEPRATVGGRTESLRGLSGRVQGGAQPLAGWCHSGAGEEGPKFGQSKGGRSGEPAVVKRCAPRAPKCERF